MCDICALDLYQSYGDRKIGDLKLPFSSSKQNPLILVWCLNGTLQIAFITWKYLSVRSDIVLSWSKRNKQTQIPRGFLQPLSGLLHSYEHPILRLRFCLLQLREQSCAWCALVFESNWFTVLLASHRNKFTVWLVYKTRGRSWEKCTLDYVQLINLYPSSAQS